jgi:hypothetical protein
MKSGALCVWLTAGLFALGGCDAEEAGAGTPTGAVVVEPEGEAPPIDPGAGPTRGAGIRRLTVDQLQAVVPVVAGNDAAGQPIRWRVQLGQKTLDAYDDAALGKVLGRPDYVTVTEEDPSPSSLYVKFVQDMARDVCNQIVLADLARPAAEPRTLWPKAPIDGTATAAAVDENLRHLVLRFHGRLAKDGDETVSALGALRTAAVAAATPGGQVPPEARGWQAVCLALIEDPAFHLH